MARRRGADKPVERLRSSWTSDADLEETLASMFHRDAVPGDKLADGSAAPPIPSAADQKPADSAAPDNLTAADAANLPPAPRDSLTGIPPAKLTPPDSLAGAPPAKLAVPDSLADAPPVKLTATDNLAGVLYETLDGLVVDAKCIRPFDAAQQGHTPSEHQVYTAMWRLLGRGGPDPESREGLLPMRLIAAKVSLSVRNLRRVLHSLMDKLAVDVTEFEDKTKSIPRRYRVWSPKMVVERRRRAGYTHIYRSRNLITLAKPHAKLSSEQQST